MLRTVAGLAAFILVITGSLILWQGKSQGVAIPVAPPARAAASPALAPLAPIGEAPSATPASREQKRFGRADKNRDGRISLAELVEPRRKAFAKLDRDLDGKLGFEEWAVKTIDKFEGADADHSKALTPAEYAATAPKVKPKPACGC